MDNEQQEQIAGMEKVLATKNDCLIEDYEARIEKHKAENKFLREHISYIEEKLGRASKCLELIQEVARMN